MRQLKSLLLVLILMLGSAHAQSQTMELLGGNTLNGAVTGTALGAAMMGLNNTNDFSSLRIGVGLGTIAGAGIAVYDLVTLPTGQQFFISGMFNDGNNTSIIILLDTFYGTAAGAVLGTAAMLVADRPIVNGLQYGASVGAVTGFGFGVFDAFFVAERNQDLLSLHNSSGSNSPGGSLLEFKRNDVNLGLLRPAAVRYHYSEAADFGLTTRPVVELFSLSARF